MDCKMHSYVRFEMLSLGVMFITLLHGNSLLAKAVSQQVLAKAIYEDLMVDYDKTLIPLCATDSLVTINIDLALRQIMDVNERGESLTTNLWLRLRWNDCRLTWDPSDYNNLTYLMVTFDKLWVPDISLYDSASEGDMLPGIKKTRAYISHTGSVTYNFPTVAKSICQVNVRYFPFDKQECPLQFGSWSHHGLEVDIENRNPIGDLESYVENSEWKVDSLPVTRSVLYYNCCPEPYPDVTFHVMLTRRPRFYVLTVICPSILTAIVSAFGFLLPVESGEKVSLQITVLLSLIVFLLLVSETLPPSSDNFPIIGTYYACSLGLVSVSLLQTVIVVNVFYRGNNGSTVPRWARLLFFRFIGRVLCVTSSNNAVTPVEMMPDDISDAVREYSDQLASVIKYNKNKNNFARRTEVSTPERKINNFLAPDKDGNQPRGRTGWSKRRGPSVKRRLSEDDMNAEWRDLANILDRIFLISYLLVSVITTLTFMLQCMENRDG